MKETEKENEGGGGRAGTTKTEKDQKQKQKRMFQGKHCLSSADVSRLTSHALPAGGQQDRTQSARAKPVTGLGRGGNRLTCTVDIWTVVAEGRGAQLDSCWPVCPLHCLNVTVTQNSSTTVFEYSRMQFQAVCIGFEISQQLGAGFQSMYTTCRAEQIPAYPSLHKLWETHTSISCPLLYKKYDSLHSWNSFPSFILYSPPLTSQHIRSDLCRCPALQDSVLPLLCIQQLCAPSVLHAAGCRLLFKTFVFLSNGALCQCGGVRELHGSIATGDFFGTAIVSQWESTQHSSEYPTDAFGELEFAGAGKRHSHVRTSSFSIFNRVFLFVLKLANDSGSPSAFKIYCTPKE
ncbi:hypothetical protein JZ751_015161 [Albula glossodonta]|uniref:Uncharacterized protein n=1 Tax=Albula glossodonta TaxID=121402 RepID=A0A8T2NRF7_9TELE|nr:hypothetical protein JZ751_015161 [Albula glossodonta]